MYIPNLIAADGIRVYVFDDPTILKNCRKFFHYINEKYNMAETELKNALYIDSENDFIGLIPQIIFCLEYKQEKNTKKKLELYEHTIKKNAFYRRFNTLKSLNEDYKTLLKENFSEEIEVLITTILSEIFKNGVVTNKEMLLKEADKGITLREVETKKERVERELKQIYGHEQAKAMVRIIGQPLLKDYKHTVRELIVDFAQNLAQPNITLNKSETEEKKKRRQKR